MSKIANVSFSMMFHDSFSDAEIEEWLRFQLGASACCSSSKVYEECGDIEPIGVQITI